MSFQPNVGITGYSGWLVLQRMEARQRELFESSPTLQQNIDYFRENIDEATSAENLVSDRRLRTIALGAFGLSEEVDKIAFVQRILESDTQDDTSLASRLSDPRFEAMADAFDYGGLTSGLKVLDPDFQDSIIAQFKSREFERAIGESDNDMRLALNFRREIGGVVDPDADPRTTWFRILGQQPLQEVMSIALNVPRETLQLDIERQQEIFAQRAEQLLGERDASKLFADPENIEKALQRFFLMRQLDNGPGPQARGFAALSMLQGASSGASAQNLILSQF